MIERENVKQKTKRTEKKNIRTKYESCAYENQVCYKETGRLKCHSTIAMRKLLIQ